MMEGSVEYETIGCEEYVTSGCEEYDDPAVEYDPWAGEYEVVVGGL